MEILHNPRCSKSRATLNIILEKLKPRKILAFLEHQNKAFKNNYSLYL